MQGWWPSRAPAPTWVLRLQATATSGPACAATREQGGGATSAPPALPRTALRIDHGADSLRSQRLLLIARAAVSSSTGSNTSVRTNAGEALGVGLLQLLREPEVCQLPPSAEERVVDHPLTPCFVGAYTPTA